MEEYENKNVHQVYEQIAQHFSQTRYKPWPVVEEFLSSQEIGSIGADVGCGNGKYMNVNPNVLMIGSDRSSQLINICKSKNLEVLISDGLSLGYRNECFDFAISIAVIHHFSTDERRRLAILELLRIVKPGGRILIFVWAFEQTGKREYKEQDVLVPWKSNTTQDSTHLRYYHMFREGELESLVKGMECKVKSGYDANNWYIILQKN